jgi:hypothetical protein
MKDEEIIQAVARFLGCNSDTLERDVVTAIIRDVQQLRQCDGVVGSVEIMVARRYLNRLARHD